jgi:hypothetical protein
VGEDSAFCRWAIEDGKKISWKRYRNHLKGSTCGPQPSRNQIISSST